MRGTRSELLRFSLFCESCTGADISTGVSVLCSTTSFVVDGHATLPSAVTVDGVLEFTDDFEPDWQTHNRGNIDQETGTKIDRRGAPVWDSLLLRSETGTGSQS